MIDDILVIGVDPGDSTGVAALRNGAFLFSFQGEPKEAVVAVEILLERGVRDHDKITLAVERYVQAGRPNRTHQPTALTTIGAMQAVAERYGVQFVLQGSADAWALADNDMLRRLNLYQSSKDVDHPDANDANMAMRHALLCLSRLHATIFDKLIGG